MQCNAWQCLPFSKCRVYNIEVVVQIANAATVVVLHRWFSSVQRLLVVVRALQFPPRELVVHPRARRTRGSQHLLARQTPNIDVSHSLIVLIVQKGTKGCRRPTMGRSFVARGGVANNTAHHTIRVVNVAAVSVSTFKVTAAIRVRNPIANPICIVPVVN